MQTLQHQTPPRALVAFVLLLAIVVIISSLLLVTTPPAAATGDPPPTCTCSFEKCTDWVNDGHSNAFFESQIYAPLQSNCLTDITQMQDVPLTVAIWELKTSQADGCTNSAIAVEYDGQSTVWEGDSTTSYHRCLRLAGVESDQKNLDLKFEPKVKWTLTGFTVTCCGQSGGYYNYGHTQVQILAKAGMEACEDKPWPIGTQGWYRWTVDINNEGECGASPSATTNSKTAPVAMTCRCDYHLENCDNYHSQRVAKQYVTFRVQVNLIKEEVGDPPVDLWTRFNEDSRVQVELTDDKTTCTPK